MATNIAATQLKPEVFVAYGRKGAGAISVGNATVGESIIKVINIVSRVDTTSSFESTVSKAGQIQQTSASDLSGNEYFFIVDHLK